MWQGYRLYVDFHERASTRQAPVCFFSYPSESRVPSPRTPPASLPFAVFVLAWWELFPYVRPA